MSNTIHPPTQVSFQTERFPPFSEKEEQVTPGRFGKRLAGFVCKWLEQHDIKVKNCYPEVWGWQVEIHHPPFPIRIGCGNVEGTRANNHFLMIIEPDRAFIRRFPWVKRTHTSMDVARVQQLLHKMLTELDGISHIVWH